MKGKHMSPLMNDYAGRAVVPRNANVRRQARRPRETHRYTHGNPCESIKTKWTQKEKKKQNYCAISTQN